MRCAGSRAMVALRFASSTRIAAIQDVVDGDPVTARIRDIVAERTMWSGSASELLRVAAPIRETTHRRPGPVGQDLPKRLQAGSGPRAQRYPLRPFSIVSAYPPTEKLSIDGLRARSRPSLVLGEFSSAASELTVMTMLTMSQAQIVQIIGCSRFGATPIIWTLESTLEARDGDPWGWLVSEAE